jgi:hypothetical protein
MTWWRTSRRVQRYARMVRGVLQSKSPRRGSFSPQEQERKTKMGLWFGLGRKGYVCWLSTSRPWPHLRAECADSPRRTCKQSVRRVDGPLFHPEPPVPPGAPSTRADDPRRTGGRSAKYGQTVRPTAADSPSSLFLFSLDIFRDKDLNMNLLGSLLMNHEGNLPYDAM